MSAVSPGLLVWIALGWAGLWVSADAVAGFRIPTLARRLNPAPPATAPWTESIGRVVEWVVARLGVHSELSQRLARAADHRSIEAFRAAQIVTALVSSTLAAGIAALVHAPQPATLGLGVLVAVVAVLAHEQLLVERGDKRRVTSELELPVVAEQLAILLSSGSSVGTALAWVAQRGDGVLAAEFRTMHEHVAHGADQNQALEALGTRLGSERVRRLCLLLSLNHRTSDLGHLVAQEAAVQRREGHRELLADLERRSQQVWIPITLAALVPGSMVLAIPLLDSLRAFNQL